MKAAKELRNLNIEDVNKRQEEYHKELLKLNVQIGSGANPPNSGRVRQLKRHLAIIHTLDREREQKAHQKKK